MDASARISKPLGNIRCIPSPILWPPTYGNSPDNPNNIALIDDQMRNIVINGDMRVDQRNEGQAVNVNNVGPFLSVDKWKGMGTAAAGVFSLNRNTTGSPTGAVPFSAVLEALVTTVDNAPGAGAIYSIETRIEGLLCEKSGFGNASPSPCSLSFWVNVSVAGTYSYYLQAAARNPSYVGTFTVAANTWTRIQVPNIPGSASGTWQFNNGVGIILGFDLGSGAGQQTATLNAWQAGVSQCSSTQTRLMATLNATFLVTGVQLEFNNVVTPFDFVRYEIQLAECQRYYEKTFLQGTKPAQNVGLLTGECLFPAAIAGATTQFFSDNFEVVKRASGAIITTYNPAAANAQVRDETGAADCSAVNGGLMTDDHNYAISCTGAVGTVVGNRLGVHWTAEIDL